MNELEILEQKVKRLEAIVYSLILSDRLYFSKDLQFQDGRNIQLATGTGTKIGTGTGQKIGFFNATPVVQQSSISDPAGGATQDAEARTAINSILDVLDNLGLTA